MPVHEAAKCKAQNCHHHTGPLVHRDVPAPGNGGEFPPHEIRRRMSDKPDTAMHQGGYIEGPGIPIRVEPAGQCPLGHAQYRINGSPYVEHITSARNLSGALTCPHRVAYKPLED